MRKLLGVVAVVSVLTLAGCAADKATFTDDDAKSILFGQVTQASLSSLGLTPVKNEIATDSVKNYVAGVTDKTSGIDPAKCADSARLLILASQDKNSDDTFYALPNLASGDTAIAVKARLFTTDNEAQKFLAAYQKANEGCPEFTDTEDGKTIGVRVTVSEAAEDSKGFRLETVAGTAADATTFRTYIVREDNLVVAVQGATKTDADANLLVAASAAIYAQLTSGQSE